MAVKAAFHAVFPQERHHFPGVRLGIDRRIMQEHCLFRISRRFQRSPQPSAFAAHYLFIVRLARVEQPAPRAAQCKPFCKNTIVMQKRQAAKPIRSQIGVHFRHGRPPVIVVSLQEQFPARKILKERKIRTAVLQLHRPGGVPRQYHGILRTHSRQPVFPQTLHIVLPAAENVHGLGRSQRQMKIPDCKNCHSILRMTGRRPAILRKGSAAPYEAAFCELILRRQ